MITNDGNSIRVSDSRHKYDSALAEYIDSDPIAHTSDDNGDVEAPTGWFAKAGSKRILHNDTRGFVWVSGRYSTSAIRDIAYETLENEYNEWLDTDDESE